MHYSTGWSHGSVVGTASWLWAGWCGVPIPIGASEFSILQNIQISYGAQISLIFSVQRELFPGDKADGT